MSLANAPELTLKDYKRRLLRVLVHIQARLDDVLSLEKLARIACFSPYHFHRLFKGMLGESVKSHVRRLRLERAAMQLKTGRGPLIELALGAGYESHEAFTRAFKAAYGVAPSAFRRQKQSPEFLASTSGVHYRAGQAPKSFKARVGRAKAMKVEIRRIEPMRVAFMRHVGPYSGVGAVWDKLMTWIGKEGLISGDSRFIGICHDDPEVTPAHLVRYDACVTVDARFVPEAEIGVQVIPGGEYAVTTHFGPYQKLGQTYARIFGQWLPRSGRQFRSNPCFEIYLNSPENTDPQDLLTDIYVPLQSA